MRFEDEELVQHCLSGDADAFGVLVHKYQDMVYAYAYQKVRNDADAKDIVQEVFLRAYRHLDQLRRPHQFRTWLYTIMSNECKRWLARTARSRQRETGLEDAAEADLRVEPEYVEQSADWQVNLEQAIAELPEDNRVVVSMFYMSDCSLKEIGRFLGVSANTVKGKLHRARQQLGKNLSQHYGRRLKEHKLEGGFLMQVMDQLHQVPRPIIPPAWREQMVKSIPFSVVSTVCVLVGMLGLFSNSNQEVWHTSKYTPLTLGSAESTTEPVELIWMTNVDSSTVPFLTSGPAGSADLSSGNPEQSQGFQVAQASLTADSSNAEEKIVISGKVWEFETDWVVIDTDTETEKVQESEQDQFLVRTSGIPIPDARVYIYHQESGYNLISRIEQETITQADGSFQFQIPRPRDELTWSRLSIVAQHPDYAFGWAKKLPWIELAEGADNVVNLNIILTRPAAITGMIADEAGNPIHGADARISVVSHPFPDPGGRSVSYLVGDAVPIPAAKTAVDGTFSLYNLPEDSGVNLDVSAPGYVSERKFSIRAGSMELIFKLKREGRIEGRVTYGDTGDSAEGIWVAARPVSSTRGRADSQTDENGRYVLSNLAAGEYDVMLAQKHPDWTATAKEFIKVSEDETISGIDLKLVKGGFITGRVTDKDTGEPIPNHGISFHDASRPESQASIHSTKTDKNGFYRFHAAPGRALVYTSSPEGYEYTGQMVEFIAKYVDVVDGEAVTNVDLQFRKAVQLTMTVRTLSPDGQPVAGVAIIHGRGPHKSYGTSDENGEFTIKLQLGQRLSVLAEQREMQLRGFADLAAQPDAEVDIMLEKYKTTSVSGQVVDIKGISIPSTEIHLTRWNRDLKQGIEGSAGMANSYGEFTIPGLIVGDEYKITAIAEGYRNGETEMFTATEYMYTEPPDSRQIVLLIHGGFFLKGRVTDTDGKPLARAKVTARSISKSAYTDEEGYYRLDKLPYTVEIEVHIDHPEYGLNFFRYVPTDQERDFVVVKAERYLAGKVIDAGGNPVVGASVSIEPQIDTATGHFVPSTQTDLQGQFRLEHIIDKRVSLRATWKSSTWIKNVETDRDDVVFVFDKSLEPPRKPYTAEQKERIRYGDAARERLENLSGKSAPELDVEQWLHGEPVTLAELKGKVVVLSFWSMWSGGYNQTMHSAEFIRFLNLLQKEYGYKGLVCIGIHRSTEDIDRVERLIQQKEPVYRMALDKRSPVMGANGMTFDKYADSHFPIVINKDGIIHGWLWEADLEQTIQELLSD